jgi:hypothetical protein
MDSTPEEAMAQAWREGTHAPATPATPASDTATAQPSDYAAAWNRHSPLDDGPSLDNASRNWNDFKKEHPVVALVASLLPVTGNLTSAIELNDAHNHGDKSGMALAATGLIPGGALVKKGIKAIRTGEDIQHVARNTLTGAEVYSASKKAGQALKNSGAAKVVTGGVAEAASTGSDLADYARAWRGDAQ